MAAPHHFLHAALLDFLLLIGCLLAVILQRRKLAALLGVCLIAAIVYTPRQRAPSYPPPPQTVVDERLSLLLTIRQVPMDEPWAGIASGVLPPDKTADWTWTNQRPQLRYMLDAPRRWVFYLRFAAAGAVLRAVGTQTVHIAINGAVVKTVTAAEPREYELRFAVDPAVLKPGGVNDVELRIAPVFIADDGVPLGVLLHSAGFMEDQIP